MRCGDAPALPLILVVADAELLPDFGKLVQFGQELVHREISHDKIFVFKSGGLGLTADIDHGIHVFGIGVYIPDIEFDPVVVEKRKCFAAPGTAALDIENW